MSQHWKSLSAYREGGMSPFLVPSQKNIAPRWQSPPYQNWHSKNQSAYKSNWSPQHYNSCPSPDGYWGNQRQWSPNQWGPASHFYRSWGSNPGTPKYSSFYRPSPEHVSAYPKTKVHYIKKHKDISLYYSPSMVEDPWAELEAKATKSPESTSNTFKKDNEL